MPRIAWSWRPALVLTAFALAPVAHAQSGPSFACDPAPESTVEKLVCMDAPLAALDRKLADAYKGATAKAEGTAASTLKATQNGWIKSRNDCWKDADVAACVTRSYQRRIAELQASYRLIEPVGSARYDCPGAPPAEASASFFATEPPTAAVTFQGATQVLFAMPSGSGARYAGGNSQFWEHQGVAMIRWNAGKRELSCPKRP
jgi:uncharacterized protein